MKEKDITIKNQMKLSLPMVFEQLVNVLMTTIDTLVIGFLGSYAVAQYLMSKRKYEKIKV